MQQLLARVNHYIQQWLRAKYRKLRPLRKAARAWERVTTQQPRALPHWKWVTSAWW